MPAASGRPPVPPLRRRLRQLRRQLLLRRRLLAALLVGLCVLAGLRALAPPPPPTVTVTVASRDLPAGSVIGRDDVTRIEMPEDTVPDDLVDTPVGRVLAGPVARGEVLTGVRLVGPALAEAQPGEQAVPVRLPDDAMADLVRAGDEIDLLATDPGSGESRTVATDVRVLAVPRRDSTAGSEATAGTLVVLALTPDRVRTVTGAALAEYLTIAF